MKKRTTIIGAVLAVILIMGATILVSTKEDQKAAETMGNAARLENSTGTETPSTSESEPVTTVAETTAPAVESSAETTAQAPVTTTPAAATPAATTAAPAPVPVSVSGYYDNAMATEIYNLLNAYRQEMGAGTLTRTLDGSADIRSAECAISFSHTRPDGSAWSTVGANVMGENLAYSMPSGQAVQFMEGWKNSAGHNANMLNGDYKTVGISVFVASTPTGTAYYAVQLFGY